MLVVPPTHQRAHSMPSAVSSMRSNGVWKRTSQKSNTCCISQAGSASERANRLAWSGSPTRFRNIVRLLPATISGDGTHSN